MITNTKTIYRSLIALGIVAISIVVLNIFTNKDKRSTNILQKPDKNSNENRLNTKYKYESGKILFANDCAMCHTFFGSTPKKSLKLSFKHIGDDYFKLFITNQDSLVNSNEPYAVDLKNEYQNMPNNHNFQYSEEDLNSLIEFLK